MVCRLLERMGIAQLFTVGDSQYLTTRITWLRELTWISQAAGDRRSGRCDG
ncbi:hypothetical protein [Symmachiella dynata]|uniref:hypothetical protein n=1 Tax=Symmachiella dynata TaxID=2527995 RepID=UPI0018D2CACB|nr:hypothetical protein [Symmachiella dynata]